MPRSTGSTDLDVVDRSGVTVRKLVVPVLVPTTAGIPFSRAMMAGWERTPPEPVTSAPMSWGRPAAASTLRNHIADVHHLARREQEAGIALAKAVGLFAEVGSGEWSRRSGCAADSDVEGSGRRPPDPLVRAGSRTSPLYLTQTPTLAGWTVWLTTSASSASISLNSVS